MHLVVPSKTKHRRRMYLKGSSSCGAWIRSVRIIKIPNVSRPMTTHVGQPMAGFPPLLMPNQTNGGRLSMHLELIVISHYVHQDH